MPRQATARKDDVSVVGQLTANAYYDCLLAVSEILARGSSHVHLAMSDVSAAFADGVLPLVAFVEWLREQGVEVTTELPSDAATRKLFINANWAYHLDPTYPRATIGQDRHLATYCFRTRDQQKVILDALLDVMLARLAVTRSAIRALEWCVNEISDNVLNHAESPIGGYVHATAFRDRVLFVVADGGIGVLESLRQGHPSILTHEMALTQAVKEGVTRGAEFGRGFGLAGTLRIAALSGGWFQIASGTGRYSAYDDGTGGIRTRVRPLPEQLCIPGTVVSATLSRSSDEKLAEALRLTIPAVAAWDYIDARFVDRESDDFVIRVTSEPGGVRSRQAGRDLRRKAANLLRADGERVLVLDFVGVDVVPSSFADEVVARLIAEIGAQEYRRRVKFANVSATVDAIFRSTIAER